MLDRVGLPAAKFPLSRYPHELSGGQRQRVVIAIACALKPKLLIADEPTTALDVVLQAQILELLRDLVDENRMGLLLISHDLAVVTEMADRITILRARRGDGGRRDGADAVGAGASLHAPAGAGLDACAGARRDSIADAARRSDASPLLEVDRHHARLSRPAHLAVPQAAAGPRRRRRLLLDRRRASRWRWSAAPAAASRRSPA